jgi:hypothetical protein
VPIGLVVPGRCEKLVLPATITREFPGKVSTYIDAKGDANVNSDAAKFARLLKDKGLEPVFLRDLDDFACRTALLKSFSKPVKKESVVIAVPCLESWYLADEEAINAVLSRLPKHFQAVADSDTWKDPEGEIKRLLALNKNPQGAQYNKVAFATSIKDHFSLQRAAQNLQAQAGWLTCWAPDCVFAIDPNTKAERKRGRRELLGRTGRELFFLRRLRAVSEYGSLRDAVFRDLPAVVYLLQHVRDVEQAILPSAV